MMQLLRDEHGLIVSFMNAQLEREKTELAAENILAAEMAKPLPRQCLARISTPAVPAKSAVSRVRVAAATTVAGSCAPRQLPRRRLSSPKPNN